MTSTKDRIKEQYSKHVKAFANEIKGLDAEGIPAPHIPIVGEFYDDCKYRIAFVGMETYGWASMTEFLDAVGENPGEAVVKYNKWLDAEWVLTHHNPHATFFGFIVRFLQKFYKVDEKKIRDKNNLHPLLTSYVWANTNAIERYCVTARPNGVPLEVWRKVKESSRRLDNINHLIKAASPKVIFLTYKDVDQNYILQKDDIDKDIPETKQSTFSHQPDKDVRYQYYYLREQDTHVFVTPHPRWMALYSGVGFDGYIDSIMRVMEEYKIWPSLPTCEEDWRIAKVNRSSQAYKYEFIADLAQTLVAKDMVMSGQQLQEVFNLNHIRTSYGSKYGEDGGRGIHKVIKSAWMYYYKKGDVQVALNIARAFTGKYGEFTY